MSKQRCTWTGVSPLMIAYHDTEWGRPVYDERKLFEFLILEGMQAGLSWLTVLKKREYYREALDDFDPIRIAEYDANKFNALMTNEGLIRNKLKIQSIISNARALLQLKEEGEDFANYLWRFVDGTPIVNRWQTMNEIPTSTTISDTMAKELKKKGFKFVGTTICYAFMQAAGMVNDHLSTCFCH